MQALSLLQPWASLIVLGAKKFETRSWSTAFRGPLLIHASKGFPRECQQLCVREPFVSVLKAAAEKDYSGFGHTLVLPCGALLGVVELLGCYRTEDCRLSDSPSLLTTPRISDREAAFGDYRPGRWAWELKLLKRFDTPISCRGALGLWDYSEGLPEWTPTT